MSNQKHGNVIKVRKTENLLSSLITTNSISSVNQVGWKTNWQAVTIWNKGNRQKTTKLNRQVQLIFLILCTCILDQNYKKEQLLSVACLLQLEKVFPNDTVHLQELTGKWKIWDFKWFWNGKGVNGPLATVWLLAVFTLARKP